MLGDGSERAGADLQAIIDEALSIRGVIEGLHSRYPTLVIEQAAIAGALNPEVLADTANAEAAAAYVGKPPRHSLRRNRTRLEGRRSPAMAA